MTWTVFGYYGGTPHRKGQELFCTWYTVDDFGNLAPAKFILSSS